MTEQRIAIHAWEFSVYLPWETLLCTVCLSNDCLLQVFGNPDSVSVFCCKLNELFFLDIGINLLDNLGLPQFRLYLDNGATCCSWEDDTSHTHTLPRLLQDGWIGRPASGLWCEILPVAWFPPFWQCTRRYSNNLQLISFNVEYHEVQRP